MITIVESNIKPKVESKKRSKREHPDKTDAGPPTKRVKKPSATPEEIKERRKDLVIFQKNVSRLIRAAVASKKTRMTQEAREHFQRRLERDAAALADKSYIVAKHARGAKREVKEEDEVDESKEETVDENGEVKKKPKVGRICIMPKDLQVVIAVAGIDDVVLEDIVDVDAAEEDPVDENEKEEEEEKDEEDEKDEKSEDEEEEE